MVCLFVCKGYYHEKGSKYEHEEKVSSLSAKWSFFQHSTVSVSEDHVEQKVESNWPKVQETGH